MLALASYLLVRSYRFDTFDRRVRREARLAPLAAPSDLSAKTFSQRLAEYEQRGGFDAVGTVGDVEFSSTRSLRYDDVPDDVRRPPRHGIAGPVGTTIGLHQYLVVSGRARRRVAVLLLRA